MAAFVGAPHSAAVCAPAADLPDGALWLRGLWQVADDILRLHGIAQKLRGRRYAEGSLRLDNVKLGFELDAEGSPVSCSAYVQRCG